MTRLAPQTLRPIGEGLSACPQCGASYTQGNLAVHEATAGHGVRIKRHYLNDTVSYPDAPPPDSSDPGAG